MIFVSTTIWQTLFCSIVSLHMYIEAMTEISAITPEFWEIFLYHTVLFPLRVITITTVAVPKLHHDESILTSTNKHRRLKTYVKASSVVY